MDSAGLSADWVAEAFFAGSVVGASVAAAFFAGACLAAAALLAWARRARDGCDRSSLTGRLSTTTVM